MKNANSAVKPSEFPHKPMPWEPFLSQTGINHRDRNFLSLLWAPALWRSWDFVKPHGERTSHSVKGREDTLQSRGAQTPQQPLGILCCTRSELKGGCALSQEFSGELFTQSPICFTLCWMLWETPKIKTPIQVLERKFLGCATNQQTPVPVGSSWNLVHNLPLLLLRNHPEKQR